jgi:hypothetical protein
MDEKAKWDFLVFFIIKDFFDDNSGKKESQNVSKRKMKINIIFIFYLFFTK